MSKRTGILLLLLAFPVFVYLFLKFFGKNKYGLPRYFPQDIIERTDKGETVFDTVFHKIPDFKLLASTGDSISQKLVEGKIYVADFFFTTCPGICPQMSSQLKRVQEAFIDDPEVLILSHTVDPVNDTLQALQAYAKGFKAIPTKWFFLTGPKYKLYDLAIKGYYLPASEDSSVTGEPFTHSSKLMLVDKKGIVRGVYDGTDTKDVDRLILEISVLKSEYGDDQAK